MPRMHVYLRVLYVTQFYMSGKKVYNCFLCKSAVDAGRAILKLPSKLL